MTRLRHSAFILFLMVLAGCQKEEEVDLAPQISFESISDDEVENFTNAVQVTIHYRDADGDLGSPDPDENTVRVKDARLPDYDWYHLPPLTPDLMSLSIEGTFVIELNPLFILGNATSETTSFEIQVRDRAGNWSNVVNTPDVRIIAVE